RSVQLHELSRKLQFNFRQSSVVKTNFGKFNDNPLRVKYEANILSGVIGIHEYTISDLSIIQGGSMKAEINQVTVLSISNLHPTLPIFTMEKEDIWDRLLEKAFMNDIDFE